MNIPILFEDDDLLVVNKPNNILVYPSYYARNLKGPKLVDLIANRATKHHPVHRLDYKTSGVIIFAKNPNAAKEIQVQFENNTIEKNYLAFVRGHTDPNGKIDSPVKNADTGVYKEALTFYTSIQSIEIDIPVEPYPKSRYSIISLNPRTGRMHQLRKYLNKISHPIIGDHKYGNRHHNRMFEEELGLPNLFLHAASIKFQHPITRLPMDLNANLPTFRMEMKVKLNLEDF